MSSHAITKVDGSASLPDFGERFRNWSVLKEGVSLFANASDTSSSDCIGVRGSCYELALSINAQPLGCLVKLALLHAELLEQGQACSPVAQAFLMRSEGCDILGLEKEAMVDVPWWSLDLTFLLQDALVIKASGTNTGWSLIRLLRAL